MCHRVLPERRWRKSSYSNGGTGECVEVAVAALNVAVRDSKAPAAGVEVGHASWRAFLAVVTA
ncbi:DUF397 domain-containing protein [Amycolatopsis antarctica]|uniref:DUF397 domain-containing protein n=1 Tax=Amycolatopsis antarctica TaxID=1854586 RepID=A0A263D819_9PSEU|nr:DUF397 domain-containing protein [Amycolatopsis antarctica]OZM73545.1 DUF397 domain-containing protein [Amycolatopsis antarctica]